MKFMLDKVVRLKFVFLIIVLFASLVQISCSEQIERFQAEQKCELELKDLPAFRGLKIGMPLKLRTGTKPQNYSVYSKGTKRQEIENVQELGYNFQVYLLKFENTTDPNIKIPDIIDTKDLDTVLLTTFDGKLVDFTVEYNESMKSPSLKDATQKFEDALRLPKRSFNSSNNSSNLRASCNCKDFYVDVSYMGSKIRLQVAPSGENNLYGENISKILVERDKERTLKRENSLTP
jgi:hypothetical protein